VQAKKNSENQIVENQDKGGQNKTLACRREVISSKPGRPGLTGPKTWSDRLIQTVTVGCHLEKYDIIHIKVPHPPIYLIRYAFQAILNQILYLQLIHVLVMLL
jgi:hypothetical protein